MRSAWESSCCNEQAAGFYRNTEMGFNTLNGHVFMSVFNKKPNRDTVRESLSHVQPMVFLQCVSSMLENKK